MVNVIVKLEKHLAIRPSIDQVFDNLNELSIYLRSEIMHTFEPINLKFIESTHEYFSKSDAIWYLKETESKYVKGKKRYLKIVLKDYFKNELIEEFLNDIISINKPIFDDINKSLNNDFFDDDIF